MSSRPYSNHHHQQQFTHYNNNNTHPTNGVVSSDTNNIVGGVTNGVSGGGGGGGEYLYNTTTNVNDCYNNNNNNNNNPSAVHRSNEKCIDSISNEYVKDMIDRISEKESLKSIAYDKQMACDYYSGEYDHNNNNNNNMPEIQRYDHHHHQEGKKSNILSKFYKPDGTPLKSLWDSDALIKEQRSYKYDPKPLERRKNPRSFVPSDKKTNDYWEKRRKNNLAARKSREDRRKKEIEVLKSVNNLKGDNIKLKLYAQKIMSENENLKYEVEMLRRL